MVFIESIFHPHVCEPIIFKWTASERATRVSSSSQSVSFDFHYILSARCDWTRLFEPVQKRKASQKRMSKKPDWPDEEPRFFFPLISTYKSGPNVFLNVDFNIENS